jgi:transcriptional regulator with XRE-family HTH domain
MPPRRKSNPRSREHGAFGEAVRRRRVELGWSQEELAEQIFTEVGQVGGIERGTRNPSYQVVIDLARVLKMRPGDLVSLADQILDEGSP